MATTSSAVPERLLAFPARTAELDGDLRRRGIRVERAVRRFLDGRPDFGAGVANPGVDVLRLVDDTQALSAWVGRVGQAFLAADLGSFAGPAAIARAGHGVVTLDDGALVSAGWPTLAEAATAGHVLAETIADALDDPDGGIDHATLERWRDELDRHARDAAFTAAFFNRLGAARTLAIPKVVEERWPTDDRWGRPEWGLAVLAPFSRALATAMAGNSLPASSRLDRDVIEAIVDHQPGYDPHEPAGHHHALLFSAGTFPTAVLRRLGTRIVTPALERGQRLGPFGLSPWGPGADPVALLLDAMARNPEAATRFVDHPGNLDLLLERWTELDGDAGRAGAEVIGLALAGAAGSRQRSQRLLDEAMRTVARLGTVRNPFAAEPLADAAAFHIDHLQRLAADEGAGGQGHDDLVAARTFLSALFDASNGDGPASRISTAAAGQVYDTVNRLGTDDRLSSEAWDVGSLLGLVLSADARAAIDDTTERIARRQALLDGIRQVTDLALTFSAGKWIPFAKAGRDHLLGHHTLDHELDEALADRDAFESALRFELSAVFAVRLAHNGALDVPAGVHLVPLSEMTAPQEAAFRRWVDSAPVRDAIGPVRIEAGQRMDEVEDALDGRG